MKVEIGSIVPHKVLTDKNRRSLVRGLERSIPNEEISNHAIHRAIYVLTADRNDEKGQRIVPDEASLGEIEKIRSLAIEHRPEVMEKIRQELAIMLQPEYEKYVYETHIKPK